MEGTRWSRGIIGCTWGLSLMGQRLSTPRSVPEQVRKVIWKLNPPPKRFATSCGKHCIERRRRWLICWRGHPPPSPTCLIFHNQDKFMEHLFLSCPWVETIWFGGMLNFKIDRNGISTWALWLHSITNSNFRSIEERGWLLSNALSLAGIFGKQDATSCLTKKLLTQHKFF